MRTAPQHVLQALRNYDRDMGLVWNRTAWYFTWRGRIAWQYRHADGTPAMNALSGYEAVRIVRAADNSVHGCAARLKAMERARREEKELIEKETRAEMEAARIEGESISRVFSRGPSPFVHVQNNPLAPQPA